MSIFSRLTYHERSFSIRIDEIHPKGFIFYIDEFRLFVRVKSITTCYSIFFVALYLGIDYKGWRVVNVKTEKA